MNGADATAQDIDREGVLFRNRWKASARDADYSGHVVIDGVRWTLRGWTMLSKDGVKYLRLSTWPANRPQRGRQTSRQGEAPKAAPNANARPAPSQRDWQRPLDV